MRTDPIPRYLPTYREDELQLICDRALEGKSLCFVGVAGTGKSNITGLLRYDPYGYKPRYLGARTKTVHFPRINATTWDGAPETLWGLMLNELIEATGELSDSAPTPKVLPMTSKGERELARLRAYIKWICQDVGHQVMFIFDDIDETWASAPTNLLDMFDDLRSRDNNKGMLSFLFFVKGLPQLLRREREQAERFKLYDLLSDNIYALKPYNDADARQMLEYLNARASNPLPKSELPSILALCGGHAGLLRMVYNIWLDTPPSAMSASTFYHNSPDIARECKRIFDKLHPQEQEAAKRAARNQQTPDDDPAIDLLARRGLIVNTNPITWFSELMVFFLREE